MRYKRFLYRLYKRFYETLLFGGERHLIAPLLQVRIGGLSLAHHMWTLLSLIVSPRSDTVITTVFGTELIIPRGYLQIPLYVNGFEPEVTAFVSHFLKPGMTVVDIGAHLGYYTLLARSKVGSEGRVFAFEPDPNYFGVLLKNLERNAMKENVYVYQMAIGDTDGGGNFFTDPFGGRGNLYKPVRGSNQISIQMVTLDNFFGKLGWPKVDLIKIDVEGAELAVIKGMKELSMRNKSLRLIIEFAADRPYWELHDMLCLLSFRKFRALEKPELANFEEIIKELKRRRILNLLYERT